MNKRFTHAFFTYGLLLVAMGSGVLSCQQELTAPMPGSGELVFTPFIAIGDEYAAGYQDGGLFERGQSSSFPALLAKQFNTVASTPFKQPLLLGNGSGLLSLDSVILSTCPWQQEGIIQRNQESPLWTDNIAADGPYHNLGIPQVRMDQLHVANDSKTNPYFRRLIPEADTLSYLSLAAQSQAASFSIWMGNTDILSYATQGAVKELRPADEALFAQNFAALLDTLVAARPEQVRGMVANLPDFTLFPYFKSIPYAYYAPSNCDEPARPLYIETGSQSGHLVRIASEEDLILLPAKELIGKPISQGASQQWGLSAETPISDIWVLDRDEVYAVRQQIERLNLIILEGVQEINRQKSFDRIALVNLKLKFESVYAGTSVDGVNIDNRYLTGGIFSLDGLYLTPRGYAFVANAFIASANESFGASITTLNINDYPGILFP